MSEQILRILLQLVDQVSGPGKDIAGTLGDVEESAGDAGESLEKVEAGGNKAAQGIQKLLSAQMVLRVLREVADKFTESLDRMAATGDTDASKMKANFERVQTGLERLQDTLARVILDVTGDFAQGLADALNPTSLEGFNDALGRMATLWNPAARALYEARDAAVNLSGSFGDLRRALDSQRETASAGAIYTGLTAEVYSLDELTGRAAKSTGDMEAAVADLGVAAGDAALAVQGLRQAQEDFNLGSADAVIALDAFGDKMDKTFAEGLTKDNVGDLAKELYKVSENALAAGANMPKAQTDDFYDSAKNLEDALKKMDVPPEVKAAFLAYINEARRNMDELRAAADRATQSAAGVGAYRPSGGSAGGGPQEGTGDMGGGGHGGTQAVGGGGAIIVQLVVDGRVLAEAVATAAQRYRRS